jgi:hypothetical protein
MGSLQPLKVNNTKNKTVRQGLKKTLVTMRAGVHDHGESRNRSEGCPY